MMSVAAHFSSDSSWFDQFSKPFIISGPCSAESEEQIMTTAVGLSHIPEVQVFRAGIWKPRTRPGEFEGLGAPALQWMKKAKEATGLKLTVEVAKPDHIEQALKNEIDMLWIGARTVVNPFSVQELAEALKGCTVPVLIKNPVTPDLRLWLGAIERIHKAGIVQLAAIHRGFHYFQKSPYRNAPMWEIPIELKRLAPQLPIITDISHICGKRELLQEIAQKAFDLETNGLMVESHYNPLLAKTDAAQQIAPEELRQLLAKLIIRSPSGDPKFESQLESLRTEIDKLDGELLQLLARRMEIVSEMGQYKHQNKITILQLKRWRHIIEDRMAIGEHLGLDKDFLLQLLEIVHQTSIKKQEEIFNKRTQDKAPETQ